MVQPLDVNPDSCAAMSHPGSNPIPRGLVVAGEAEVRVRLPARAERFWTAGLNVPSTFPAVIDAVSTPRSPPLPREEEGLKEGLNDLPAGRLE